MSRIANPKTHFLKVEANLMRVFWRTCAPTPCAKVRTVEAISLDVTSMLTLPLHQFICFNHKIIAVSANGTELR